MWQRFTEKARRVILLGQEEAGKMNSRDVGTEHLLLGLAREAEGVVAQVFQEKGVSEATIRCDMETGSRTSSPMSSEGPKLTPQSKRVLELAADEARRMHHKYIGTEHLLLGLVGQKDGLAAQVLTRHGLNLQDTRAEVIAYLNPLSQQEKRETLNPSPESATQSFWKQVADKALK